MMDDLLGRSGQPPELPWTSVYNQANKDVAMFRELDHLLNKQLSTEMDNLIQLMKIGQTPIGHAVRLVLEQLERERQKLTIDTMAPFMDRIRCALRHFQTLTAAIAESQLKFSDIIAAMNKEFSAKTP